MTIKASNLQVRPEITTYGDNYTCVANDMGVEEEVVFQNVRGKCCSFKCSKYSLPWLNLACLSMILIFKFDYGNFFFASLKVLKEKTVSKEYFVLLRVT